MSPPQQLYETLPDRRWLRVRQQQLPGRLVGNLSPDSTSKEPDIDGILPKELACTVCLGITPVYSAASMPIVVFRLPIDLRPS